MKKRIISLLLVVALVVGICPAAFAAKTDDVGVYRIDNTETQEMSAEEIKKYQKYTVVPETESVYCEQNTVTTTDLLEICTLVDNQDIGGHTVNQYTSTLLPDYLVNCKKLIEIATIDEVLYITFETYADETVYLTYNSNGLVNQIIYDAFDDTAYMLSAEETTKTLNFRQGTTEVISEELLQTINSCIQANDYSVIKDNPNLTIDMNADGTVIICPKTKEEVGRSGQLVGFTNETDMLNDLKREFPLLKKYECHFSSVYIQYLSKNVNFKVVDNRDSYTRIRADFKLYAASTALTVIAAFLGTPTTIAAGILTALDIGLTIVDGIQKITEAVKLYRGARFSYTHERYGLVRDTTRFNDYVNVFYRGGSGEFSGGYKSDGTFNWHREPVSVSEMEDFNEIKSTCAARYNADLNVYGYCESYYPLS